MSQEIFLLPDVGEGLVEAEIVTWKVKVGDVVELNQPLVDIETAKATVELPSPYAGTVLALHGEVGDLMEVHKPLITFEVLGEPGPATSAKIESPVGEGREAVLIGYGVANEDGLATRKHRRSAGTGRAPVPPVEAVTASPAAQSTSPRSTPPVRLYAKQHGIDLAALAGSGRDGLITRGDVERAVGGPQASSVAARPSPVRTRRRVSSGATSSRGRPVRRRSASL